MKSPLLKLLCTAVLLLLGAGARAATNLPPVKHLPTAFHTNVVSLVLPTPTNKQTVLRTNVTMTVNGKEVPLVVTNAPPMLTLTWTPSGSNWLNFPLYAGHATGQWTSTNTATSNVVTLTNFNTSAPWVFAVAQKDKSGLISPLSTELWWNAASNGIVYSEPGHEYVGFVALSNLSYQIQGVMGTATNVAGIYAARPTNSYGALALPGPGYYRLGRFTNQ